MHFLRTLLVLCSLGSCMQALAQVGDSARVVTATDKQQFLYFTVPIILNGSNIDPSPIEAFAFEFKGTRATFKTGFRLGGSTADDKGYRFTFTAKPYVKAKDERATLYSKGQWAADFGCDFGLNWIVGHNIWVATQDGVDAQRASVDKKNDRREERGAPKLPQIELNEEVSERVQWLSLRYAFASEQYTLLNTVAPFDDMINKTTFGLGSVYMAYNLFFQSQLPKYRKFSAIVSAGVGYGSFSNYLSLDERTLIEGSQVFNVDSTAYRTVAENTAGRSGTLAIRDGFTGYVEAYFPILTIDEHDGRVRIGARVTTFAPATEEGFTSANGGVFVTARKETEVNGKKKNEDKFNFSLTANFDRIQSLDGSYDMEKWFSLQLGVAVPLRF